MLIRGYINQLCGKTPTDLRMGTPLPTTNFVGLPVTLTETQREAAINSKFQSVVSRVNLKNRSSHNRNASSCSELLLILTTQ
jgi:hypothetical protein